MQKKRIIFIGTIFYAAQLAERSRTGIFVVADRLFRQFLDNNDFEVSLEFDTTIPESYIENVKNDYLLCDEKIVRPSSKCDSEFQEFLRKKKNGEILQAYFMRLLSKVSILINKKEKTKQRLNISALKEQEIFIINPAYNSVPKYIKREDQKIHTVHIIYDLIPIFYPQYFNLMKAKEHALYKFLKGTNPNKDIFMSISMQTKKDLLRFFNRQVNSGIFYLGFENKIIQSSDCIKVPNVLRTEKKTILSVSTIEPRKNLLFTVKLFQLLENKFPGQYQLVVVGAKGWEKEETYLAMTKIEGIHWMGYVSDHELPCYYQNAHVFVYPSFYEGFGLPVLEAMSYGVPTLVSQTSSLPEVAGEAGLYVDPNEAESGLNHIEALREVSTWNHWRTLSIKQAKKFSWNVAYENFCKELEVVKIQKKVTV